MRKRVHTPIGLSVEAANATVQNWPFVFSECLGCLLSLSSTELRHPLS